MDPYEHVLLKRYQHFSLYLHVNGQSYLGRSVAWLARQGDMQRFSQLTNEELAELHQTVLPEYEAALQELWQPDHMNYAWLGNLFGEHGGHGHMHLIPRYNSPRLFNGRTYVDERWGRNYAPTPELELSENELFAIRDALRVQLQ